MKPITLIAGISIILTALSAAAKDSVPSLPFSKAAQIAQTKLEELHLPPEFFIHSVNLIQGGDATTPAKYEAIFEPTVVRRVRIGTEPEPVKYKVIVISMDGTAAVEEREHAATRDIKRKIVEGSSGVTNTNK